MLTGPFRKKVEVVIFHRNKICVCTPTENQPWYGFPGGGIDEGEDILKAAERESLEEAAIRLANVKEPFPDYKQIYHSDKPFGKLNYYGTELRYVTADFKAIDKTLFNSENDGRPIIWFTIQMAIGHFSKGNQFDKGRAEFLKKYKKEFM